MIDKEQAKKEFNTKSQMIIIAIVVFFVSIILFSVITWFLKLLDTKEDANDPKNAPAAARAFMNDTNIDENGKITLGKSIAEWWEELKKNGNKITKYLDSPEELAKLMNAAMALEYPDTRENPDDPIDWNKIDINSKEIQGIVKFKRALKDGGKPISMTYVSPSKFQELISKYNNANNKDDRKKALDEVLKHFTMEKSYENSSNGGSPIVEEALKYACSWVGKVTYKSHASGDGDNEERFLPLKEGRGSDCSHFIHWVFEHVGLMDKDNFIHSLDWGNGGDNGGCPGTVRIGTDLSQASPGDVIWWHFGDAWNNHVAIYLGNEKMVECAAGANGVVISKVTQNSGYDQILHFSQLPTDPTGYFDPDTMTLHSSISSGNGDIAKVGSLNGMVFIGDSIMYCLAEKDDTLKQEGAKYIYRGGSTARYFLGEETASGLTNNCIENNGYFNWNANFKDITNPTGFYIVLGQNFYGKDDRIEQMDELIKKIRSQYPTPPIYISSVLHNLVDSGSEENATKMNGELKVYCAGQNNVYYSDILRGYNDNLEAMTESDNDHPNPQGAQLLVKNIKENIVGTSSGTAMTTATTSTSPSNSVTGEMIVQEAEKYVGKLPYVSGGQSLETGADCSGFAWAILKKLGLIDWGRTNDVGFRNKGTEVSDISQAQPGDILCFNGHISIYKGNGYMVEALNSNRGVVNDRKVTDESRNVLTIRRFTNASSSNTSNTVQQPTSTYKVKVATWNESEDIMDAEDPAVSDYHNNTYNITTTTIPYQPIVGKFKMPFNYLWTMLVYSQDKDYVFDLAKLVDNSKIEITIHDNYTETTNVVTDKYTKYKKVYTTANANVDYNYFDIQIITDTTSLIPTTKENKIERSDSTSVSVDDVSIYEPSYTNVHTTINRNNSLDIALTLADSWFAKYTKEYTYNKPTKMTSPPSTSSLDDIWNDPEKVKGDFGGHKDGLTQKAEDKAIEIGRDKHGSAFGADVNFYDVNTEYTTGTINRSTTTKNTVESSSYVSSVPGGGGISLGTSISNVKTGSLNKDNYIELPSPKTDGDGDNPLQGFCIVEDSMMAYVIHHYSTGTCSLFLVDSNTTQEYDRTGGFTGHGNTIAYDPVNAEIIFPENGVIQLVKVNKVTKKFEGRRSISPPQRVNYPSQIAYNATHDLFIANSHVYTRDAFYSGGEPIKDLEFEILEGDDLYAGSTSYGNHVYYYFADGYGHSTNYLVVCDLNTGGQVELIHDNMAREGEEASFSSDGTLYLFHGEAGSPFHKTDYNYFYDTNIDTLNVKPGVGSAVNDIARYNTGGEYTETGSFEKVFNSHYNARTNILSVTEWLFEALEQNSDTEKMADLTRYLFHKATGNNYGEYGNKQFNYDEYDPVGFNEIGAGGLEGNTTEERVWLALINAGFNDVAAAAAMGNLSYESGGSSTKTIKTDVVEGGYNENNGGIGMCQWTNGKDGEGRNTQLKKYAQSKGTTWKDEKTQIEFLITEITGEGSAKGYAHLQFMKKTYDGVTYPIDALKTVENNQSQIEYATKAFAASFERPAASAFTNSMSKRVELANYFYSQFNGKRSASTSFGPSSAYANKSAEEKAQFLFPGGIPTTKSQAESYLTTINVPITKKDGTRTTKEVQVHKAIAQDVYNACLAAQNSGFKIYDIGGYRPFGTDTAGKSGGLSYSQHCYGLAVDINPTENGQFKNGKPTGDWFYSPGTNEYSIQSDSVLVSTFKSMGWGWGGEWKSSKDYMHFSFMGT